MGSKCEHNAAGHTQPTALGCSKIWTLGRIQLFLWNLVLLHELKTVSKNHRRSKYFFTLFKAHIGAPKSKGTAESNLKSKF